MLSVYNFWGYLDQRIWGYMGIWDYFFDDLSSHMMITADIKYPITNHANNVFILLIISYTRDYGPSSNTPEIIQLLILEV
jgi:hypothetical protein